MAKDITLTNAAGDVIYYPKTVSELVYDNETGNTIKEDIAKVKEDSNKAVNLADGVNYDFRNFLGDYYEKDITTDVNITIASFLEADGKINTSGSDFGGVTDYISLSKVKKLKISVVTSPSTTAYICFYNANKNKVASFNYKDSTVKERTNKTVEYVVKSDWAYCRTTLYTDRKFTIVLNSGILDYNTFTDVSNDLNKVMNETESISSDIKNRVEIQENEISWVDHSYISSDGSLIMGNWNEQGRSSDFIPVSDNCNILKITSWGSPTTETGIFFYDANKTMLYNRIYKDAVAGNLIREIELNGTEKYIRTVVGTSTPLNFVCYQEHSKIKEFENKFEKLNIAYYRINDISNSVDWVGDTFIEKNGTLGAGDSSNVSQAIEIDGCEYADITTLSFTQTNTGIGVYNAANQLRRLIVDRDSTTKSNITKRIVFQNGDSFIRTTVYKDSIAPINFTCKLYKKNVDIIPTLQDKMEEAYNTTNLLYKDNGEKKEVDLSNSITFPTLGYIENRTGTVKVVDNAVSKISDFIDIGDNEYINVTVLRSPSTSTGIHFYNSSKVYISGLFYNDGEKANVDRLVKIPNGCRFVRVVVYTDITLNFKCVLINRHGLTGIIPQLKTDVENLKELTGKTSWNCNRLPQIFLTSSDISVNGNDINGLTISKNEVSAHIKYSSKELCFEDDCVIAYQGNSTLHNPKKGFSLDLANKYRFKNWIYTDSYHLKAYYIDWTHSRDLVGNRLLEQIYLSREDNVRPYEKYNDFGEDCYKYQIENGVTCHIDGFPVELYINGVYWGLYSLNMKKNKDNYFLNAKNKNHIQFEPDNNAKIFNSGWNWQNIEIRSPKKIVTNADGSKYNGDAPKEIAEGDVKTSILSFVNSLTNITTSTTEEELESFLNTNEFVDWYLFNWFIDNRDIVGKNTLYTTWDSIHWALLIYDLDNIFGCGAFETGDEQSVPTYDTYAHKANGLAPWINKVASILDSRIKARYKELRENGIFTVKNVKTLFDDFTREVGADAYEKDLSRWEYPSYGKSSKKFVFSTRKVTTWLKGRITFLDNKFGYATN